MEFLYLVGSLSKKTCKLIFIEGRDGKKHNWCRAGLHVMSPVHFIFPFSTASTSWAPAGPNSSATWKKYSEVVRGGLWATLHPKSCILLVRVEKHSLAIEEKNTMFLYM